jgi:O-acetyl-ADP-ribose deacetylase (regulator of RNase III)
MLQFTTGNLLEAQVDALVNTVNCVGVMGKGLALQFKQVFPENFTAYPRACGRGEVQPGRMFVFATGNLTPPKFIINFPTKRHWKMKSSLQDVADGLDALLNIIRTNHITSIAIPPLGCGLGGLDWQVVRKLIETKFDSFDPVRILIYEPG